MKNIFYIIAFIFVLYTNSNSQTLVNEKMIYFHNEGFDEGKRTYDTVNYGWDFKVLSNNTIFASIILYYGFDLKISNNTYTGFINFDRNLDVLWKEFHLDTLKLRKFPSFIRQNVDTIITYVAYDLYGSYVGFHKYNIIDMNLFNSRPINHPDMVGIAQYSIRRIFEEDNSIFITSARTVTGDTAFYELFKFDLDLNLQKRTQIDTVYVRTKNPLQIGVLNNGFFVAYSLNMPQERFDFLFYKFDKELNLTKVDTLRIFNQQNYPQKIINHNNKIYLFGLDKDDNTTPVFSQRRLHILDEKFNLIDSNFYVNSQAIVMRDIIVNQKGNFVFCGNASMKKHSQSPIGSNKTNFIISEIDTMGNLIWEHIWGDTSRIEQLNFVKETPEGTYIATGSSNGLYYICEVAPPSTNVIKEEPKIRDKIKSKYDKGTLIISIDGSEKNVGLYDINGKEIGKWETYHQNTEVIFEMSNFDSGVYFIKASSGEVLKFIHLN